VSNMIKLGRKQQGLTLVELMVALVLGMLVMVGVIQLFISNKETYRVQDGLARVQEAGRFAVYLMNTDIAGGANLGCSGSDFTEISNVALGVPAELTPDAQGRLTTLSGMNNVAASVTLPSGFPITPVAGTDIINVRGVSSTAGVRYPSVRMADTSDDISLGAGNLSIAEGELLYLSTCMKADIFRATNSVPAGTAGPLEHGTTVTLGDGTTSNVNSQASLVHVHGQDAVLGKLRSYWYFVADSGVVTDGQPVFALYRKDHSTQPPVELVTGVEDMQITYGIDNDGDTQKTVDTYVTANNVANWSEVISVRINLLVNSVTRAAREAVTYDYSPVGNDQTPAGAGDRRLRREFAFVTTLRNHTR